MLIDFRTLWLQYGIKPIGVLHVGANVGEERQVYRELGVDNVAWIEANPEIYRRLQVNLQEYPQNVAYNFAAGDENKPTVLHISNNGSQSSSVLELGTHLEQHPEVHYVQDIEIEMRTLDTFKLPFEVDFLNMDIQGYELQALKGLGERIKDFKWIYLEVNKAAVYVNCGQVEDIDFLLGAHGLTRVETSWVGNWGDALYVR